MKRLVALAVLAVSALAAGPAAVAHADTYSESLCQARPFLCVDPYKSIGTNGQYTGHDEPSVLFYSHRPGTGNDLTYAMKLPKNPPMQPNQAGTGGTFDFQLRATFWLGLTMCDSAVGAELHRKTCPADSDRNARFTSTNPSSPRYLGKAPGQAYMELQFYEPSYIPQFDGFGCSATKWCANLTIDSLSDQSNTGVSQNADCLSNPSNFLVGEEPINWAYVTKSGKSQAPANPLALSHDPNETGLKPNLKQDLLMNSGDTIRVHMHDTRAGFRVDIKDLTTGGQRFDDRQQGQRLRPGACSSRTRRRATCGRTRSTRMYSSAVRRGTIWGAHTYNVAASDEIGHFEYCNAIDPSTGACTSPGAGDTNARRRRPVLPRRGELRRSDPDQGLLPGRRRLRRAVVQARLAGHVRKPGGRQEGASDSDALHRADSPADGRWRRSRSRSTWPASSAASLAPDSVMRASDRSALREPASGRAVLSLLLADQDPRSVHVPAGRRTHSGHDEPLRRVVEDRVREAALRPLPVAGFTTVTKAENFHRDLGGNPCSS